ncbi:MAG: hypothetical protein U9Q07_06745 [Planctomycetota bacterium]|nr:hypothetical protein [Planctomycetota bacterium]
MAARNGRIGCLIAVGAAVLFFGLAVAEAGSTCKPYSSAQKRQTAYDILREAKRKPQAARTREIAEIGPVVARARLRPASIAPRKSVGYFAKQMRDTTLVKPPELRDVPADAPPEPVYFALDIDDRKVHGITYRSTDRTKRAKLRLDTDGDGLLSDEREYVGTWLSVFRLQTIFEFGPVSIRHTGYGSKASRFYIGCADGRYVILYATHYREGQVKLDGRTHKIALVDCNYNGRYNNVLVPPIRNSREPGCDAIAIDLNGNSKFDFDMSGDWELMPLSRLVKISDIYYHLDITDDGEIIEFHKAQPAFGTLDLGDKNVAVKVWSDAGHQHLFSSKGKWRLPAGKYAVVELKLTETDSAGNRWLFDTEKARGGAGAGELGVFEVRPDETTSFEIGPPFQIKTSMKENGKDLWVSFYLEGRAGELYVPGPKKNGKDIPVPQFQIISATGQTIHSGQFEFA